jgi:hypothetical protein
MEAKNVEIRVQWWWETGVAKNGKMSRGQLLELGARRKAEVCRIRGDKRCNADGRKQLHADDASRTIPIPSPRLESEARQTWEVITRAGSDMEDKKRV